MAALSRVSSLLPSTSDARLASFSSSELYGRRLTQNAGARSLKAKVSSAQAALKDVPKQFRGENLKEGLMENFKNVPESLYGLNPQQMTMFMSEDSAVKLKGESLLPETITASSAYREGTGMWTLPGITDASSRLSMSMTMSRGGYGRPLTSPPDLPSLLLDARIVYLGMPLVPAVTELLVAELFWLEYDNPNKPIYIYINSTGTQNEKRESIGFETEAYTVADVMNYVKAKIYTVNIGQAYGQAAMLLSLGHKGKRAVQPNAMTKIYAPKVSQSSGSAIDMWIKAKELDANTDYYIKLLARGTGKTYEEIARDIQRPMYFRGQDAIDYGLVDMIIPPRGAKMERRNYDEMLAQSKAAQQGRYGRGPVAAGSAGAGGPPGGGRRF